jgi:transglutaminase-like putative cysteine protease
MPWVVAAVVFLGAVCVGVRVYVRRQMELYDGDGLWRITYSVEFHARKAGAKVRLAVPADTRCARVYRQDLLYSGLNPVRSRPSRALNRQVDLVTLRPGSHTLTARFDLHLSPRAHWRGSEPPGQPSAEDRAAWLRGTKTIQVDHPAVAKVLAGLRREGARPADLVDRLFDYCIAEIETGEAGAGEDAAKVLETKRGTPLGRARALVALCRAGKVPARLVAGFEIKEDEEARPRVWVEALTNHHWEPFDPVDGYAHELPHTFVPVRRDATEIVHVGDAEQVVSTFSLVRLPPSPGIFRSGVRANPLEILDLTRLPLEMHDVLAVILLMPLGALVTAVFRTVIGIRTFGTFTPTLLALAFVYNDWRTGLFVFVLTIGLGLVSRALLDRLKLLMVPRLSLVLTLVVWCIIFSVSLLDYFHVVQSTKAVLLPMVILTMTVERFYLTTEEDGPRFAVQLMAGTTVVAACCYAILRWDAVGNLLLAFPELHLFTIAALILLGRYTGYRLTELWRFRDLLEGQT